MIRRREITAPENTRRAAPPWLISFGDMMTLFLCFFIMLVTLSKKQEAGLVAAGLGPLVAAMENRGNDLPLTGAQTLAAVNVYRLRFGLAPITDEERLLGAAEVKSARQVESLIHDALRPHAELREPHVARFAPDSDRLDPDARLYLDALSESLRPGKSQMLLLEGRGAETGTNFQGDDLRLAAARAQAVKDYLCREHGFVTTRVEARASLIQGRTLENDPHSVDARLMQTPRNPDE